MHSIVAHLEEQRPDNILVKVDVLRLRVEDEAEDGSEDTLFLTELREDVDVSVFGYLKIEVIPGHGR